jgi:hypothetical protein
MCVSVRPISYNAKAVERNLDTNLRSQVRLSLKNKCTGQLFFFKSGHLDRDAFQTFTHFPNWKFSWCALHGVDKIFVRHRCWIAHQRGIDGNTNFPEWLFSTRHVNLVINFRLGMFRSNVRHRSASLYFRMNLDYR